MDRRRATTSEIRVSCPVVKCRLRIGGVSTAITRKYHNSFNIFRLRNNSERTNGEVWVAEPALSARVPRIINRFQTRAVSGWDPRSSFTSKEFSSSADFFFKSILARGLQFAERVQAKRSTESSQGNVRKTPVALERDRKHELYLAEFKSPDRVRS